MLSKKYHLGLDVGGTNLVAGVMNDEFQILAKCSLPAGAGRSIEEITGDMAAGKVLSEENAYWIFSNITSDSFHWENVRLASDGERRLICEIFGRRSG